MWENPLIKIIDNGQHIAPYARRLIRAAIPNKWRLKPKDAVHLASVFWYNKYLHRIEEFHTYDPAPNKYEAMIGINICEPQVQQPKLME